MDGGCKCQVAKCTSPLFPSSRFLSLFLSSFRVICLTLSFSSFVRASPSSFHANCAPPVFDKHALAESVYRSLVQHEATRKDQAAAG